MNEEERKNLKRLFERINVLENHLVNLIIPIHRLEKLTHPEGYIQQLQHLFSKKITLDDSQLRIYLDNFLKEVKIFTEHETQLQIKQQEILDKFKTDQATQELKYICKRLHEIECKIERIEKKGLKNNLNIDVSVNGKDYMEEDVNASCLKNPNEKQKVKIDLNKILSERDVKIYQARSGIKGSNPQTFQSIAEKFKLSSGRVRQIYKRCLLKIRAAELKTGGILP